MGDRPGQQIHSIGMWAIVIAAATLGGLYKWASLIDQKLVTWADGMGLQYPGAPEIAPVDIKRAAALIVVLEVSEMWSFVLPLGLLAWLGQMAQRRLGTDPKTPVVFGVQATGVLVAWLMGCLWFGTVVLALVVVTVRRAGIPPFPILVAHMVDSTATQQSWKQRRTVMTSWTEMPVSTPDGMNLFALKYEQPGAKRWAIFFNANAMLVQSALEAHERFAKEMNCNLVSFNYRGCGGSTGLPRTGEDLVTDGAAVLRHVANHFAVDPNCILLYGSSLGGCVATLVRALPEFRTGPLLVDRSFSTVADAAMCLVTKALKSPSRKNAEWYAEWVCEIVVLPVMDLTGWSMLAPSECMGQISGTKVLTNHLGDGVLPPGCQTHEKSKLAEGDKSFQLANKSYGNNGQSNHCYPITEDPLWPAIKDKLNTMF